MPCGAVALEDVAVERIEGLERLVVAAVRSDLRKHAAFGRVRIDVIEMGKSAGYCEIAEGRHAVALGVLRGNVRRKFRGGERARRQHQKRWRRLITISAAPWPPCSASHHQMVGNADSPYFGMVCGWPKRSQRAVRTLAVGPLRHDVEIPQQHAVERLGGGDQLVAVLGEDDALDQLVDRRVLDADQVARAGLSAACEPQKPRCSLPGDSDSPHEADDDVEVPLPQPVLVLRGIDGAHGHRHAEPLQRRLVEQHDALEGRLVRPGIRR